VSDIASDQESVASQPPSKPSPQEPAVEPEAAEVEEDTEEKSGPSRTAFRAAVVFAAQQHRELQHSKDTRAGVEQVASRMTSALLTYDYRNLDKTKQAVLALATGKFRTDYDQNFGGLASLFTTTKGQSTATVKDVFVSGVDHDTATAIVVFDERTQGTSGQHLSVDLYLRLSLVKVKGQWRVDDVTNLNFPVQPSDGTTPTTTPAK
jgi:Mce-associated membrane protein